MVGLDSIISDLKPGGCSLRRVCRRDRMQCLKTFRSVASSLRRHLGERDIHNIRSMTATDKPTWAPAGRLIPLSDRGKPHRHMPLSPTRARTIVRLSRRSRWRATQTAATLVISCSRARVRRSTISSNFTCRVVSYQVNCSFVCLVLWIITEYCLMFT